MDLTGRLSNPPEAVETLPDQGWSSPTAPRDAVDQPSEAPIATAAGGPSEQRGRLSNPVQRRLSDTESDEIVYRYRRGESINGLARELDLHRTTVINHLDRAGVTRRHTARKMTDISVARAAEQYLAGAPLTIVAQQFGVHPRTLAKELRRAGTPLRPRPGRGC